jgi:hypothetical protein
MKKILLISLISLTTGCSTLTIEHAKTDFNNLRKTIVFNSNKEYSFNLPQSMVEPYPN